MIKCHLMLSHRLLQIRHFGGESISQTRVVCLYGGRHVIAGYNCLQFDIAELARYPADPQSGVRDFVQGSSGMKRARS
jgi:hypothetical protein